ncbi:hypothetical protein HW846_46430 [Streptomyces sp. NE06-02F]|uniref:hypothetical protein n=1 Tax=Streptomyces caniscabiei TaxID=2746961 RepID=UPI001872293C|nr:hypothetical protein [Streptomyces caniscabiei]MBE4790684.1 hypothetical protein [Streptomyces caniscabiei]MDX2941024.1 hypothetical protein [Streptomyces caniscabiei]
MKRIRRVTALMWSRLGYTVGCLTASVGVGWEFGPGWGLTVGGALGAASCLLLVDVGESGPTKGGDVL